MYTIYAAGAGGTETVLFSDTMPDSAYKALSPRLTLTAGAAGSLSLTLPKSNAAHAVAERLTTTMRVVRDGETIWMGRVLSEKTDIWGSRTLFCEGAMAYLNDTIPMVSLTGAGASAALSAILTAHNQKVAENRRITLGTVTVSGTVTVEADGSESLQIINSKLVGALGGVLRMRYPSGVPTLDWLANYPAAPAGTTPQELVFGTNLLDFVREWDMTDFATYCYVRGAEIEQTVPEGQPEPPKQWYNSGWVASSAAALYGRIEKYLDYSDLDSVPLCQAAAQTYLATQQFAAMKLDVTALDLRIINPDVKSFDLLETVQVQSPVHGLDSGFVVTGLDIPLDAPESTKYTLGNQNIAYVRRVNTITKVTQANQQAAIEYADTAADGALSAANDHTDAVKVVLEAKDTEIEASVTAADGRASQALITADEIKGKVTDAQGNYTVANLKADGFYIADAQGKTLITGTMIDVDTIHVNKLYGGYIYLMVDAQTVAGSFYAEAAGGPNPSSLTINFQDINMGLAASVTLPDISFIYVYNNGQRVSLRTLLGL